MGRGSEPRPNVFFPKSSRASANVGTPPRQARVLTRRSALLLGLGTLLTCLRASPAQAQQFGQWSWDGSAGLTRRDYQNLIGSQKVSTLEEQDLGLSLGVNGFIVHPAVLRMRLDVDAQLSTYRSSRVVDARRWGFRGNLAFLPQSLHPFSVYGGRQLYDYSHVTDEDPLNLIGLPDTATTLGSRLRLRSGPLRGTLFGYDQTWLRFLTPGARPGGQEQTFLDWARPSRSFQRHVRVERRVQQFGAVDFTTRDLTASTDLRGALSPSWRWESYATAIHRSLSFAGSPPTAYDTARTSQKLIRTRGARGGALDVSYDGGLTRGSGTASFQSHSLMVRYLWRPRDHWSVTPYAGYAFQAAGASQVRSPQGGVSGAWHRRKGKLDVSLNPSVGLLLSQHGGDTPGTDSLLAFSLGGSVGHGGEDDLRKELETAWSRNQLRVAGQALTDLPDLGASLAGVGTEEAWRARAALRRRWGTLLVAAYTDWARREPSGGLAEASPSTDNLSHTLQLSGRRFNLTGAMGDSRVHAAAPQRTRYAVSSLSVRPWHLLELSMSYRSDTRQLSLAPDVDGRRAEASAHVLLGAMVLQARGFLTTESVEALPKRTDRGLVLSLSRRFGGWLPIVTGAVGGGENR